MRFCIFKNQIKNFISIFIVFFITISTVLSFSTVAYAQNIEQEAFLELAAVEEDAAFATPEEQMADVQEQETEPTAESAASKGYIMVDPGHIWTDKGRPDSGYVSKTGVRESDLNLQLGAKLVRELVARGYKVRTTLPIVPEVPNLLNGPVVSLAQRAAISNSQKPDAFISIHHNGDTSSTPRGALALCSAKRSDPQAIKLAQSVMQEVRSLKYTVGNRTYNNGIQFQEASVLTQNKRPAFTYEAGFLSNSSDLALVTDSKKQQEVAKKIADGVDKYLGNRSSTDANKPTIGEISFNTGNPTSKHKFVINARDVKDSGSGIRDVKFQVWAEDTPQRTKTRTGILNGGTHYKMTFKLADFGNRPGTYCVKVTARDKEGNETVKQTSVTIEISSKPMTVGRLEFSTQSPTTQPAFQLHACDVEGDDSIKSIIFRAHRVGDNTTARSIKGTKVSDTQWNGDFNLGLFGNVPGTYYVRVYVEDQMGNKSILQTGSIEVKNAPVNTNGTVIMGTSAATVEQMVAFFKNSKKAYPAYYEKLGVDLEAFAQMYYDICQAEGVRADVAWVQMCHETGYLSFTGDVKLEQLNFAGIGATGGGERGYNFAAVYGANKEGIKHGIIGHVQHLKCYASNKPVYYTKNNKPIDPRFYDYLRNSATTVEQLTGKWAVSPNYSQQLLIMLNRLLSTTASLDEGVITLPTGPVLELPTGENIQEENAMAAGSVDTREELPAPQPSFTPQPSPAPTDEPVPSIDPVPSVELIPEADMDLAG